MLEDKNLKVKQKEIADVMKKDLNMSYRKIQTVTLRTNSEKNLVLRQQFGLHLIEMLQRGKRIINVDQTWLGMSDFRRRKWRAPASNNSVAKLLITPRISMIMAVDTNGEVFFSLVQSNSNAKIMEIFF